MHKGAVDHSIWILCLTITIFCLSLILSESLQGYILPISVTDGGGRDGSSNSYKLHDSAAQPAIGDLASSASYRHFAGFWYALTETIPPCPQWHLFLSVSGVGIRNNRTFGVNCNGSNGYDFGLDTLIPPPGFSFYSYFQGIAPFTYLSTDIRSSDDSLVTWHLVVTNNLPDSSFTVSWDSSLVPDSGCFIMADSVDMRNRDSVLFCCGNMTIPIRYSFVGLPSVPSELDAIPGSNYVTLSWSDVSGETGYLVRRDGILLDTISSNSTSYIDSTYFYDDTFFGEHCYNISAINYCGESGVSASVCETLYLVKGFTYANHDPQDTLKGVLVYIWEKPAQFALSGPELKDYVRSNDKGYYQFKVPRGAYWVFRDTAFFRDTTLASYSINLPKDSEDDSLVGLNFDGYSGIEHDQEQENAPSRFCLFQNYPNPFNPQTDIRYYLPIDAFVRIEIFNILGQRVRVLLEEQKSEGYHTVYWDGKNSMCEYVSSGVYYYRMQALSFSETKRMVLLR